MPSICARLAHADMILKLARSSGLLRTRDVDSAGAPRAILARLMLDGRLVRVGRGLYALPDRPPSEPSEIWLAVPHKAHRPRMDLPPLPIVRMSGEAMTQGIDEIDVAGTTVRVFCVAKTVADCFKFRNKVGLDVALEALRVAWQGRRVSMDEL